MVENKWGMPYGLPEWVFTSWLLPNFRKSPGMFRFKLIGLDACLYWPTEDWGWGIALMFWGYGFDCDTKNGFYLVHEENWYWIPPKTEEEFNRQIREAMKKARISAAMIYAFEKTGRLVTEENMHNLTPDELDEWRKAVDEYTEKYGENGEKER